MLKNTKISLTPQTLCDKIILVKGFVWAFNYLILLLFDVFLHYFHL